jgi:Domain of unknown function (DUF3943)
MLNVLAQTAALLAATANPDSLSERLSLPPPSQAMSIARATPPDDEGGRRRFNLGRAGLQLGGAMALGVGWYESQIELNKLDFDFDRTFRDQTRRLFTSDGYRFDDNNRVLNVGHAFMGAYYHQLARQNGGGMAEALLFDFVTSSTWELTVEHREVISLNDTVTTSLGGVAVGESLYQIGDFFARSRPTVTNRILMGLFSPAHAAGLLWGDRPEPTSAGFDQRGFARDAHHRFALGLGAARAVGGEQAEPAAWEGDVRFDLELVNLASYGKEAVRSRVLGGGEFTRINVDYRGSREDLRALTTSARASLWGAYHQRTTSTSASGSQGEGLRGHALFLGSATAFDLIVDQMGDTDDFITALHLIGPAADLTVHRDRLSLRLATDVLPDFAMVRPFALDPARGSDQLLGQKSTVRHHAYYYALGVTTTARAEAQYRKLRAGGGLSYSYHDSIEGLDRHQTDYVSPTGVFHPAISDDAEAVDQRLTLRLFGDSGLPATDMRLGVSLDYRQRTGTMSQTTREQDDLRFSLLASYAL